MMYYFYVFLGILLRRQAFEVNNGNDDWMDLVHPEKYGLTQTQNFYMAVIILSFIKLLNSDINLNAHISCAKLFILYLYF